MKKIKIGDTVKVIAEGATFTTYEDMAKKLKATKWTMGNKPDNGDIGLVVNIKKNKGCGSNYICLVDFGIDEAMVGDRGLELIETKPLGNTIRGDGEFVTKDSGKRKQFKEGMVRDISEDKTRYDLVYMPMLKRWADLMSRGAKKYGERNWELAESQEALNRFRESALRHMFQWFNGDIDEDHASAVFFNISGAEMVLKKLNDSKRTKI